VMKPSLDNPQFPYMMSSPPEKEGKKVIFKVKLS